MASVTLQFSSVLLTLEIAFVFFLMFPSSLHHWKTRIFDKIASWKHFPTAVFLCKIIFCFEGVLFLEACYKASKIRRIIKLSNIDGDAFVPQQLGLFGVEGKFGSSANASMFGSRNGGSVFRANAPLDTSSIYGRLFYAQRNAYLIGFVLLLAVVLFNYIKMIYKVVDYQKQLNAKNAVCMCSLEGTEKDSHCAIASQKAASDKNNASRVQPQSSDSDGNFTASASTAVRCRNSVESKKQK